MDEIIAWSNRPSPDDWKGGCLNTNVTVAALGRELSDTYQLWYAAIWELQEQALFVQSPRELTPGQP